MLVSWFSRVESVTGRFLEMVLSCREKIHLSSNLVVRRTIDGDREPTMPVSGPTVIFIGRVNTYVSTGYMYHNPGVERGRREVLVLNSI